jgi:ketosteroid isomerase-like protein
MATSMNTNELVTLIHDSYRVFAKGDKAFFERNLADDFTFSAPPDPLITREEYFKRWSGSGGTQQPVPDIKRTIVHGDEVVITYERIHDDGSRGRNTEIHTVSGGKIRRTEVYWGWNIKE